MIERQSAGLAFAFNPDSLSGTIRQNDTGQCWSIDLPAARGVVTGQPEPMWAEFPWTQKSRAMDRLASADGGRRLRPRDLVRHRELPNGVELDFRIGGAEFRITLALGGRPDEFVFTLLPLPTGRADLVAAELPGPIMPGPGMGGQPGPGTARLTAAGIQVLTAYRHQGRLLTGAAGALEPDTPHLRELNMSEGRYRLRFFGVLGDRRTVGQAASGYVAIIDENADARIIIRQGDDYALSASVAWAPSMGTIAYTRTIRYRFQSHPTVTTLAKGFREYARSAGMFKSLKEKIAERPVVGKLVGATACFIGYEAGPFDYVGTFRKLREMGHTAFYAFPLYHINAFGGNFAGLTLIDIRDQADALRKLGAVTGSWTFLAGVPDRPDWHRHAARNADGTMPSNWRMDEELWPQMCMRQARQFFAAQGQAIADADAHHFDTTASNALMECYAPSHPMDRRGDRASRIDLFSQALAAGCFVASEGVKDWAVPHYDMGSNKEIPVKAETAAFRVVPIQHLVYHDALFSLWWEVHPYDCPHFGIGGDPVNQSLTDLLYGDMPLIFPVGRQFRWWDRRLSKFVEFDQSLDLEICRDAAQRAVRVARHFARVATEEMTDFAWLTEDGTVQRTQFANGVGVIANFGACPFDAASGAILPPRAAIEG